jgi:hypothetical protein
VPKNEMTEELDDPRLNNILDAVAQVGPSPVRVGREHPAAWIGIAPEQHWATR